MQRGLSNMNYNCLTDGRRACWSHNRITTPVPGTDCQRGKNYGTVHTLPHHHINPPTPPPTNTHSTLLTHYHSLINYGSFMIMGCTHVYLRLRTNAHVRAESLP